MKEKYGGEAGHGDHNSQDPGVTLGAMSASEKTTTKKVAGKQRAIWIEYSVLWVPGLVRLGANSLW